MDAVQIVIWVIIGIIALIRYLVREYQQEDRQAPGREPGPDRDQHHDEHVVVPPPVAQPAAAAPAARQHEDHAAARQHVRASLDALTADLDALLTSARVDGATRNIAEAVDEYVTPRARAMREEIAGATGPVPPHVHMRLEHLALVCGAGEMFIGQRRTPELRQALGDADAIAMACYQPVIDFAQANRFQLSSARPVAVLTALERATWTGLVPTGLAPLVLPSRFFDDIRWWPAVAHEIAHDFLAVTGNAEARIRDDLGLPSAELGTRANASHAGMRVADLYRLMGGFFEELFCDVFATVLLGPVYAHTMVDLFAAPHAPHTTTQVVWAASGRYDRHPPRYLRVLMAAKALSFIEEHEAADEILARWQELHGAQPDIVIPTLTGAVGAPVELFEAMLERIAEHLCSTGSLGLNGHSLLGVPGLAYGPHLAAEARRAAAELVAGRVPADHPVRAVLAGAIMAWRQQPDAHDRIMALARRAIVGVTEHREDIHDRVPDTRHWARASTAELRQAFLLHTILSPPPSLARMRRRGPGTPASASSFLARRQWP